MHDQIDLTEFVKMTVAIVQENTQMLAKNPRMIKSRLSIIENFLGDRGLTVARIHHSDIFPTVLSWYITDQHIYDAIENMPNVSYQKTSMWFTIKL
jgi:hypothetical protein